MGDVGLLFRTSSLGRYQKEKKRSGPTPLYRSSSTIPSLFASSSVPGEPLETLDFIPTQVLKIVKSPPSLDISRPGIFSVHDQAPLCWFHQRLLASIRLFPAAGIRFISQGKLERHRAVYSVLCRLLIDERYNGCNGQEASALDSVNGFRALIRLILRLLSPSLRSQQGRRRAQTIPQLHLPAPRRQTINQRLDYNPAFAD